MTDFVGKFKLGADTRKDLVFLARTAETAERYEGKRFSAHHLLALPVDAGWLCALCDLSLFLES